MTDDEIARAMLLLNTADDRALFAGISREKMAEMATRDIWDETIEATGITPTS